MSIDSISISGFMTTKIVTDTEDQNISSASKKMDENNIGSVIVVNNDKKAVGIITERDVVRILGKLEPWLLSTPLSALMSKPLITIRSNGSLRDAIQTMYSKNIRRLPVISDKEKTGEILGIVTDKDIFRTLMKNQNLVQSLLSENAMSQNIQTIHERFAEYWFGDILIHRK
ncbi:MAG: CBS domain-containing protein [Nitrososphaeraceae archaeon]|jgi:CBS domain-containing protein